MRDNHTTREMTQLFSPLDACLSAERRENHAVYRLCRFRLFSNKLFKILFFFFFLSLRALYLFTAPFLVTVVFECLAGLYCIVFRKEKRTFLVFVTCTKRGKIIQLCRQCEWTIDSEGETRENLYVNFVSIKLKGKKTFTIRYFNCLSVSWCLVICCVKNKSNG